MSNHQYAGSFSRYGQDPTAAAVGAQGYSGLPGGGSAFTVPPPQVPPGELDLTWLEKLIGKTNEDGSQTGGYGQLALGAAQGAASTFLGLKQYGLAKDSFKQNKREFGLNYDANRTLTNSRLEDRQRARVATGNSGYQSVSSYLDQNAVAPRG